MENIETQTPANEDAELDSILEKSIEQVKAGEPLDKNQEVTEPKNDAAKTGDPSVEANQENSGEKAGDSQEAENKEETEFRIPNKGPNESDAAYEKRLELYDLVQRRKSATTPEAKQKLSEEIKAAKGDLKEINSSERFTKQNQNPAPKNEEEIDPDIQADKERLRQLGGATREDIEEIIKQTERNTEIKQTVKTFVEKSPQLKDEDVRDVFFEFVDSTYNWQDKSAKELSVILELAYENMFKPSETIQERVLKGAEVQEKVNAMQFPGGTVARPAMSADKQKAISEMTATGMSEEKARELIDEE